MSDITINNDESQSKKQKMAPVEESLNMQNQADIVVENAILKIWQGYVESNHDLGFWRPTY